MGAQLTNLQQKTELARKYNINFLSVYYVHRQVAYIGFSTSQIKPKCAFSYSGRLLSCKHIKE